MSKNFYVKVLLKKDTTVRFKLKIIWSEQHEFYDAKNFALQLIWSKKEPFEKSKSPLYKKISYKKISDIRYILFNDSQFIISSMLSDIKNFPKEDILKDFSDEQLAEYWNKDIDEPEKRPDLPEAILEVKVTSPEWIEHLNEGDSWTAYVADYFKI